jgi:Casein kinase II regulatory subunit
MLYAYIIFTAQQVLPVGESDRPNKQCVRVYCPKCRDIYHYNSQQHQHHQQQRPQHTDHSTTVAATAAAAAVVEQHDGAYWGTTAAHLIGLHYKDLLPTTGQKR